MRNQPPEKLIELLAELGLATAGQVQAVERRARRLAKNLPRFESVWVDALAQARLLTPFQAAQINTGKGRSLRVGPYVLSRRLPALAYASCYQARELDSGQTVRLAVIEPPESQAVDMLARLENLAARAESIECDQLAPVARVGTAQVGDEIERIWAACRYSEGQTAAERLVRNGRFQPHIVLDIAQQMLAGLAGLEHRGPCHGDIGADVLLLADDDSVVLTWPGLRAAIRPAEGYAQTDMPPEAYDCLAPERIVDGTPPTPRGDIYSCGCLWWQMLAGRPPLPGGNALAKMRSAQTAKIPDIRQLAPDTPEPLAAAVMQCIERDPQERPRSIAQLAELLGDTRHLAPRRSSHSSRGTTTVGTGLPQAARRKTSADRRTAIWWSAMIGACLVAAVAIGWSIQLAGLSGKPVETSAGSQRVEKPADPPEQETDPPPKNLPPDNQPEATELVLDSASPAMIEPKELRAGLCVRGEPGERPLVRVPRGGLEVNVAGVRFQGIDFLWDHDALAKPDGQPPAIIRLAASSAEFTNCTFRSKPGGFQQPLAFILWTHPAARKNSDLSLPSGRIRLKDCTLLGGGIGLDCRTVGAIAIELDNTLCQAIGPLIRLDHAPAADEPVAVGLAGLTLRGGGPLLECRHEQSDRSGTITVRAVGCVLAPDSRSAVLVFSGSTPPNPLLANIRWSGQGSLVLPATPIAQWRQPDGTRRTLDDTPVTIAGLVRSAVAFAGPARSDPASSRVIRWQAPIRSSEPPGANPARLPRASDRK